ncbi:MAG: hypothetical protein P4M09_14520 [Devosia sp.]|nr:hypothetical protein [Devosia sp.]
MPNTPTTLIDELVAAARGIAAILVGDRRAAGNFDFSQRGLAGSFIAFLVAALVGTYAPSFGGDGGHSGLPPSAPLFIAGAQMGLSALVLRQLNRLDGFVPYLVADNWATFFLTAISSLLAVFGFAGDAAVVIVGIVVLIIEINIARLIVTLSPWQIAMFLVAQAVGTLLALAVVLVLFPLPPDATLTP